MVLTARRTSHVLLDNAAAVLGLNLPSWEQRREAALQAFLQARDQALADGAGRQDAWSAGFQAEQAHYKTEQEGHRG